MRIAVLWVFWAMAFTVHADPVAKPDDVAACASGSAAACRDAGDRARDRKDYVAADDRYEQGCKLEDGEACGRLAFGFLEGNGRPKDPVEAAALFEQACGQVAAYCGMLGQLYANGLGVARDPARAVELMRRACDVGMPAFCSKLGAMLADGYGTVIDEPGALAALDQGCRGDDGFGCLMLGTAYEHGELGLARRVERGRAFLARACELGQAAACTTVHKLCAAEPKTCGRPLVSAAAARLSQLHKQLVDDLIGKRAGCDQLVAQGSAFVHAHAQEIDGVKRELEKYGTRNYYVGLDGDLLGKLTPLLKACPDGTVTVLFDAGFRPGPHSVPAPAAAEPSPASEPVARPVSSQVLEPLRVTGQKVILPDAATKTRIARYVDGKLVGSFKLCVSAAGDVVSVRRLKSTGFPAYDATIEAAIWQWKYRPVIVEGQAVPVCTAVTYVYSQS